MIVLDTNVLSEIAKPDMDVRVRIWVASQAMQHLFTTAVTLAEVTFGIAIMPDGVRKTSLNTRTDEIFRRVFSSRILPFDETAARAYGRIVAAARAKGRSILMADGQIASIAQSSGFTVATRDTAPFEAAGVPVINPWNVA
ncbi:putative nucleic acid-binding protein [Neorhizobium huautlense]|uniref:Ribonuclease VapC n=1 Tax=Neorhizobium huautlense TaxID=67774 RepID=A0ABT9PX59_9HYPH|nr:type II toxin-antitoxin system VapC family toxin [Neorhizobium huautlense]MDP9839065.1 putative nucleic acid-binding protein [Neorhizobium huautlense]